MSETQNTYLERRSSAPLGWIWFAAIMLILIGVFHAIAGLAGIIENEFYSVVPATGTEATGDHLLPAVRRHDPGMDPSQRWAHRPVRRHRAVRGRGLGSDSWRDRGRDQRHRELCVATVVSGSGRSR